MAALVASGAALLGFALLSSEVVEGETRAFDMAILQALRVPGNAAAVRGPPWLAEAARDATALGSTAVLTYVAAAAVGYLLLGGRQAAALLTAGAVVGGAAVSTVLKLAFARPGPDFVPQAVAAYTASFPSGHTMLSAVTYLTLAAVLMQVEPRRWTSAYILALAVLTTLLVGASRIYLGVHWPTDVLAGWSVGAGWALLCWLLASQLQSRLHRPPSPGASSAHG